MKKLKFKLWQLKNGLEFSKIPFSIMQMPVVFCWFVSFVVNQKNGWQGEGKCKQQHSLGISPKPNTALKFWVHGTLKNSALVEWTQSFAYTSSLVSETDCQGPKHISCSCGLAVGPAVTSSQEEPVPLWGSGTRPIGLLVSSTNKVEFQFFLPRGEMANFLGFSKRLFSPFLKTACWHKHVFYGYAFTNVFFWGNTNLNKPLCFIFICCIIWDNIAVCTDPKPTT